MNRRRGVLAAWILLGAGCASGPAPRTYVLTAPTGAAVVPGTASGHPRLQLQRVQVPDYLDTTDLVLRQGPHELTVSRSGQWGERLSSGLTHALAAALAERLPQDFITLDSGDDQSMRQILVEVSAFDVWADGRCALTASWSIRGKQTQSEGSATFKIPAAAGTANDAAVVAAMARAVGQLADRLAQELSRGSI